MPKETVEQDDHGPKYEEKPVKPVVDNIIDVTHFVSVIVRRPSTCKRHEDQKYCQQRCQVSKPLSLLEKVNDLELRFLILKRSLSVLEEVKVDEASQNSHRMHHHLAPWFVDHVREQVVAFRVDGTCSEHEFRSQDHEEGGT